MTDLDIAPVFERIRPNSLTNTRFGKDKLRPICLRLSQTKKKTISQPRHNPKPKLMSQEYSRGAR